MGEKLGGGQRVEKQEKKRKSGEESLTGRRLLPHALSTPRVVDHRGGEQHAK